MADPGDILDIAMALRLCMLELTAQRRRGMSCLFVP